MKIYSYDPSKDGDLKKFYEDLGQETDKGAAIASYAFIEEILREILKKRLIIDQKKDLNGHIKRLRGRLLILFCFAVGVLTEKQKDDLLIISDIRNDFGHKRYIRDFGSKEVSDKCNKLRPILLALELTARKKFDVHVSYYLQILKLKSLQTRRIRRVEREYPSSIAMLENLMMPVWKD
jgi:hypothetical protein